jgi:hypothetical protein
MVGKTLDKKISSVQGSCTETSYFCAVKANLLARNCLNRFPVTFNIGKRMSKSFDRVGIKIKFCSNMKTLNLEQMVNVNGGVIIPPYLPSPCGDLIVDLKCECHYNPNYPMCKLFGTKITIAWPW